MNCAEFKIWLDKATVEEIKNPLTGIKNHMEHCHDCRKEYLILKDTFNFIERQKRLTLTQNESEALVQNLIKNQQSKNKTMLFQLSRVTAAAVIILGLITGILAGTLLSSSKSDQEANTWSSEFSTLSDNSDYVSYLFD